MRKWLRGKPAVPAGRAVRARDLEILHDLFYSAPPAAGTAVAESEKFIGAPIQNVCHTRIPASVSVWQAGSACFTASSISFVCISLPEEAVGMSGAEERDPLFISCTPHKP